MFLHTISAGKIQLSE